MKYLYRKDNKEIIGIYSDNVDVIGGLDELNNITKNNLDCIQIDIKISDYNYYKVDLINKQLIKRPQQEIDEIQQYGKILTDSERTLNKLKPSYEEVQKAQNTIEILTLIQEVM